MNKFLSYRATKQIDMEVSILDILPRDVLTIILCACRQRRLLPFMLVCKTWKEMILTREFMRYWIAGFNLPSRLMHKYNEFLSIITSPEELGHLFLHNLWPEYKLIQLYKLYEIKSCSVLMQRLEPPPWECMDTPTQVNYCDLIINDVYNEIRNKHFTIGNISAPFTTMDMYGYDPEFDYNAARRRARHYLKYMKVLLRLYLPQSSVMHTNFTLNKNVCKFTQLLTENYQLHNIPIRQSDMKRCLSFITEFASIVSWTEKWNFLTVDDISNVVLHNPKLTKQLQFHSIKFYSLSE